MAAALSSHGEHPVVTSGSAFGRMVIEMCAFGLALGKEFPAVQGLEHSVGLLEQTCFDAKRSRLRVHTCAASDLDEPPGSTATCKDKLPAEGPDKPTSRDFY